MLSSPVVVYANLADSGREGSRTVASQAVGKRSREGLGGE
jgi:hypothetical protein